MAAPPRESRTRSRQLQARESTTATPRYGDRASTGAHTTARVLVEDESLAEDESLVEESALAQIQELIDHPAFTEPVRIMPDTHIGAGAPIGFTMPLGERIVPNIVGVDVGCGMAAANLGDELPSPTRNASGASATWSRWVATCTTTTTRRTW